MRPPHPDPFAALLEEAIDGLPEDCRLAFLLRDVEGLSAADAGACLNLSGREAEARRRRAHVLLRRHLAVRVRPAGPALFTFAGARCDALVAAVLARLAVR